MEELKDEFQKVIDVFLDEKVFINNPNKFQQGFIMLYPSMMVIPPNSLPEPIVLMPIKLFGSFRAIMYSFSNT